MNKLLFCFLFSILLFSSAYSQDECAIHLKEAEQFYDEGKIEKIPSLLIPCLQKGFNREEKVKAYRLLTLVYIYEDNYKKADSIMLLLLRTSPEYAINTSLDPAEFISLYDSYDTDPAFSIGLSGGINYTFPRWTQVYGIHPVNNASPAYSPSGIGFNFGPKFTYHLNTGINIVFEPAFYQYNYEYSEEIFQHTNVTAQTNGNGLSFLGAGQYNYFTFKKISFWAEAGFSFNYIISEDGNFVRSNLEDALPDVTGPSINTLPIKNKQLFQGVFGNAIDFDMRNSKLHLNIRYNFALNKAVNSNSRGVIPELEKKYFYIEDDVFINQLFFSIGYSREIYLHKKKL
jgi:hypothetical protein